MTNTTRILTTVAVLLTAQATDAASAAPITVPSGLNPGDTYRLAFVTSTTRDASSSDIMVYNDFVTSVANSVPELQALGTIWLAIGSTTTADARDNTVTNPSSAGVPIYRLDGTLIASGNADLWDGSLNAALQTDEMGGYVNTSVWTGTLSTGEAAYDALGATATAVGLTNSTTSDWIAVYASGNLSQGSLYAISRELTVVPEPSSVILGCIGAIAFVGLLFRKRRQGKPQYHV